jgi:anti-sigma B factor antagonist
LRQKELFWASTNLRPPSALNSLQGAATTRSWISTGDWSHTHVRWPRAHHRTERLTVHSARDGQAHVLQPVGELDLETVGQLEDELKRVEATDVPEIRVDLSGVDFIDSDGLKLFIKANARCSDQAGRLLLVRSSAAVHRAFQTTGLESRLPFADRPGPSITDASTTR